MRRSTEHLDRIKQLTDLAHSSLYNYIRVTKVKDEKVLGYCYKYESPESTQYDIVLGYDHKLILMHEYGHIYLGHLDFTHDTLDHTLEEALRDDFQNIASYINSQAGIDFAEDLLEELKKDKSLNHYLHNIAMDMEVNTRILSPDDVKYLESRFQGELKLVLPERLGFDNELSYPEYFQLIIRNLDKFVTLLLDSAGYSGENKPENTEELIAKLEKEAPKEDHGEKRSEIGQAKDMNLQEIKDPVDEAIEEVIKNHASRVIRRKEVKDLMYLYNRGINRSVLAPRYLHKDDSNYKSKIVFLLDVSSSMKSDLISRILWTIRDKLKHIDKRLKYGLICWSTRLEDEYPDISTSKPIPHIKTGGGTRMAKGITYIDEKYPKSDILVLLSDCLDSLDEWKKVTNSIRGRVMYVFNYGPHPINSKDYKNLIIKNFKK